ncbi:MAG: ferrous iron transporter B [Gemmatimonadetes bacterium]|uniref:Ferrous iron transporter B n=1 Tax=Candidatus Kutchimonas denitrificans TaxID=3056748 RepID=A0AAE5CAH7_9BACT|nr:ferrous iron transporter B [Gemmatimonadota bacterium]NIR76516.1 ferrous iron transporter B [Candidatus Kutchimonas denitrificans]NIS03334.1 ferrous iron transporter B [Gemmatimonadota bacterium]NIT69195.1 ferrous iron transporter B [Gemmatimonadota bacterium]NIU54587.1 ferrous iron transport protein B [Gemmatimonadota bacterium]
MSRCHTAPAATSAPNPGTAVAPPEREELVVLVGNPNVGKSAIFSALSGRYAEISNFPGTTVEALTGQWNGRPLIDAPGTYGLGDHNEEERITSNLIGRSSVIINVVDAAHLDRDLFLTTQLAESRVPMVVALNLMDEARESGSAPDAEALERALGVPVVPTVAVTGEGVPELAAAVQEARPGTFSLNGADDLARRRAADELYARAVPQEGKRRRIAEWLGRASVTLHWGIPMIVLALTGVYYLVGVAVAQHLVDFTETRLGQEMWEPFARSVIDGIGIGGPIREILVGEFGLFTMTVTYVVFLLAPLVAAFYFALALLEDSGFLPRIATLVDRLLGAIGLNGRAVIPIILGFGCVTMGTITTRLLSTRREKTIATALLNFAIPCSAQLAVIAALLAGFGGGWVFAYAAIILAMLVMVGTVLDRMIPGVSTPLLIELPPLRWPRPRAVLKKTFTKGYWFMREATPWFAAGALIVSGLQVTGGLDLWQRAIRPVMVSWLHLPAESARAIIMGLVRRDYGAAGLYDMGLSAPQALVALIVITLFVPCVASIMVMAKEHGARTAVRIWIGTWIVAFAVGGVLAQILHLVGAV